MKTFYSRLIMFKSDEEETVAYVILTCDAFN